jgi:prepilin-type processing-associated H-X9-DG protein
MRKSGIIIRQASVRGGFTLMELFVIVGVVAILAALLLPALVKDNFRSKRVSCINNLKQVGLAFRVWGDNHNDVYPPGVSTNQGGSMEYIPQGDAFRHFQCLSNELPTPKVLVCPNDSRWAARNFAALKNTNISYFVGVDSSDTMPQMLLTGHRNLVINGAPVGAGLLTIKSNDAISWTKELHGDQGNAGMADGSVQQFTTGGLQGFVAHMGTNTFRLAIP